MKISRREAMKLFASSIPAYYASHTLSMAADNVPAIPPAPVVIPAPPGFGVADGPFKPNWESLAANYQVPDWYRDAKFGIWAHWGPKDVASKGRSRASGGRGGRQRRSPVGGEAKGTPL